jgi:DNA-binding HxlR family transcriptional regulator
MPMTLDGVLADRDSWQATHCSIDRALSVVGTRSAMLLLREACYGTTRFHDFAARVGITEAVAAARLRELVDVGIFQKRPYRDDGQRTRHEYLLTDMGRDLLPALIALMQWGDRYLQGDDGPLRVQAETGEPVHVRVCTVDGTEVPMDELHVRHRSEAQVGNRTQVSNRTSAAGNSAHQRA